MRILITGATGLVGSQIVKECHRANIQVHYLSTRPEALESREDYRGFLWDPAKGELDRDCFKGVDAVINLAGSSIAKRWTEERKKKILNSRIDSLRTLGYGLSGLAEPGRIHLVTASAIGIYPDSLSAYYEEEDKVQGEGFLAEVVRAWENEADQLAANGIPVAKIRIGMVMAREGGALPEMARPVRYYAGAALGSGQQWQSWIHIEDLARMFLFAIDKKLTGVYNGVAPNPVTHAKLIREIAGALGKPLILPNIPSALLKLVLGEMSSVLLGSQRASSKKIENTGFHFLYPNICRALKDLYQSYEDSADQ